MSRKMTLEEIQRCCLGILSHFDGYCAAHNLKYYLVGGSALGAVRHRGMIPWDDDVDVGMPRADYDRFCSTYVDTEPFELLHMGKTEGYFQTFAKLCDTRTAFDEPISKSTLKGVFIDVFPLDYVCDSQGKLRKCLFRQRLYRHAFLLDLDAESFRKEPALKRFTRRVLSLPYRRKDPATVSAAITADLASPKPTNRMMNIWGAWGGREVVDAECFGDGIRLPFGGSGYPVPSDWDKFLTTIYGDYMTPSTGSLHYHGSAYWIDGRPSNASPKADAAVRDVGTGAGNAAITTKDHKGEAR